jgi:peptidoglycan/xylan/chitin deacetylase (PgdA/CDA1 family)
LPSSRHARRVAALALALALLGFPLSGCGRKAALGTPNVQGAIASPATSAATGTKPATASSAFTGPAAVAPLSTLQPPAYDGFEPLPCFTYHHVDPKLKNDIAITPATFESQLKMLSDLGYHTITARQLYEHQSQGTSLPDKPVMITFDDGWRNQYMYAFPLLKKYGMVATFFINPQPIVSKYGGYLTRDMVLALSQGGNDIESHTWRHLKLTRDRADSADAFQRKNVSQLTLANEWIRKVVGVQPIALCYPYGYYDLEAIGMAQRVGYRLGFTTDEGIADARGWDAFQIKRFTISNVETAESFKRRLLSGALSVRDIQPAPAARVVGNDATVTVDISAVPADITGVKLSSGPGLRNVQIVERNGHKYAEATFKNAKVGFREMSMRGTGADGRKYYASWGIVLGDLPH